MAKTSSEASQATQRRNVAVSRRTLIASAGAGALGVGATVAGYELRTSDESPLRAPAVPFHGAQQAGIVTPMQQHLHFAAFDLTANTAPALRDLLREWSLAAARLTGGRPVGSAAQGPDEAPDDPGEADGLASSRLTVTFGLGPRIFTRADLGLGALKPPVLEELPAIRGDALDPDRSGGDLCVQACADDPQVAFHAVHALGRVASGAAVVRWAQAGFRSSAGTGQALSGRNLLGFKDGTNNIRLEDAAALRRHVWVGGGDDPDWMRGGTYLVVRRIRMLFDVWDGTSLDGQERAIGRHKATGAPLGSRREGDRVDLNAEREGAPAIPLDAHIRLASAKRNDGQRILRRSYSFADGVESEEGQLDAGLFFISFQRDPQRQFVRLQRRLAERDALAKHLLHTGSAVFACPPGARRRGYVGETLLSKL